MNYAVQKQMLLTCSQTFIKFLPHKLKVPLTTNNETAPCNGHSISTQQDNIILFKWKVLKTDFHIHIWYIQQSTCSKWH